METSLASRLQAIAERYGNRIANTFVQNADPAGEASTLTFRDLAMETKVRVRALAEAGLAEGETAAVMLPLSSKAYPTLLATMMWGTAAPMNYFLERKALDRILKATGAKVLLTGNRFDDDPGALEKIRHLRAANPRLVHIACGDGAPIDGAIDLEALAAKQRRASGKSFLGRDPSAWPKSMLSARPDRVAALMHTGGTTGTPKLVPHTEAMYLAMVKSGGRAQGTLPGEVMLSGLPLFHASGALQSCVGPLLNGVHVVVPSSRGFRDPNAIRNYWAFVERFKVTIGGSVPTVLAALSSMECSHDVSTLKRILCGGAPLSKAIIEDIRRKTGAEVLEGWGMTETCGFSIINPMGRTKVGAVGAPFDGVEAQVRVLKASGELAGVAPRDTIGELVVRGDIVIRRYRDSRPDSFTEDGWLRTGDLARIDPEGYFWITGRAKDLIIRGGHNIDPALIEEPAYQHPAVQLAAAIGRPDKYAGELPVLYVQLKPGASATAEDLETWIKPRIQERAATPKAIHIVSEIPLSGPGKISKLVLREREICAVAAAEIAALPSASGLNVSIDMADDAARGRVVELSSAAPISAGLRAEAERALGGYAFGHRWRETSKGALMPKTIETFKLTQSNFTFFGASLNRPECVWADNDGVWVSDNRGGVARVRAHDGPILLGSGVHEPNGFSRRANGNFVVAGLSDGALHEIALNGETRVLLDKLDNRPLGTVNHAWVDRQDRIWVSVMTRHPRWYDMLKTGEHDGYIVRIDERGPAIVADGIALTNEVKVSPDGRYLYAAESQGPRIIRFPIRADGSLGQRETVGPDSLGHGGSPDGFAFDAEGNVWVTLILRNGISVITPDGAAHVVYEEVKQDAVDTLQAAIAARTAGPELMLACAGDFLRLPTSLDFGGPDGRTVYVGSLLMPQIATFRSPTAGFVR